MNPLKATELLFIYKASNIPGMIFPHSFHPRDKSKGREEAGNQWSNALVGSNEEQKKH